MGVIENFFENRLLVEITLQDHFDTFVNSKYRLDFDEYRTIARLDPTTTDNRKGKYVDWILKTFVKDGKWNVNITYFTNVQQDFVKFIKKPADINKFKTYQEFHDYVETIPEESNREIKKKAKDIFNSPDDIKILSVTDEWIIIETLTREGNIMGAQYKTSPQANWCTAYLDRDNYWNDYSRRGDLIQIINKKEPKEKYQVFIDNKEIVEERDYNDRVSRIGYQLLINNDEFIENYGKIKEKPPFKFTWDEYGTADNLLGDGDGNYEYLNRRPETEEEYDNYYEEAIQNEEFQINHWDRFLENCYDIYENNYNSKYSDIKDRMEYISGYFKNPITQNDADKKPASDVVYDMYTDFDTKWEDFVEDEDFPLDDDELDEWWEIQKNDFLKRESIRWSFIEYFLEDFPYKFRFDKLGSGRIDNTDKQLKFNFESIMKILRGQIL